MRAPEAKRNIGAASKASGVHVKMIRHYEELGLIARPARTEGGYRVYDDAAVHTLRFIRRARDLGFPIADIKVLVGLWRNKTRASSKVRELALRHVAALEEKIRELDSMKEALATLARRCGGDDRPECPILADLES